ncbi:MAG: hypothetical protein ABIR35_13095 [Polaromonas sp.]
MLVLKELAGETEKCLDQARESSKKHSAIPQFKRVLQHKKR